MGLMARCLLLKAAAVKTGDESSGPAVIVTAASGDEVYTAEVWGQHGLYSLPPDGTMGVRVPTDPAERFAPVVATHHYKTTPPAMAKGDAILAATTADGATVKIAVHVHADGTLSIRNASEDIYTLVIALIDYLLALDTAGSPGVHYLGPNSTGNFNSLKTRFQALLSEGVL